MCIYDDTVLNSIFFLLRHWKDTSMVPVLTYGYYVGRRLGRGCAVERYEVAFRVPTSEAARQNFFWLPWLVISYFFNLGQRRSLKSYATLVLVVSYLCIGARLYVIRNSGCTFCLCTSTFITSILYVYPAPHWYKSFLLQQCYYNSPPCCPNATLWLSDINVKHTWTYVLNLCSAHSCVYINNSALWVTQCPWVHAVISI